MPSCRPKGGRQVDADGPGRIMAEVRIACRQEVLLLKRARCVVGSKLIKANIYSKKVNSVPRNSFGHYAVNPSRYHEIVRDFAIGSGEGPRSAWSIGGSIVRELRKYQVAGAYCASEAQREQRCENQISKLHVIPPERKVSTRPSSAHALSFTVVNEYCLLNCTLTGSTCRRQWEFCNVLIDDHHRWEWCWNGS